MATPVGPAQLRASLAVLDRGGSVRRLGEFRGQQEEVAMLVDA
jgi:hypothetical protein